MSAAEELWGHFYTGDRDRDLAWDSAEWLGYLNNNKGGQPGKNDKMR